MSNRLILMIEDDSDLRHALAVRLRGAGHTVQMAADVAAALHAVRAQQPALILLDLGLPGGGGFRFLDRVRQLGRGGSTPVIVLSAWDAATHETRAREAGAVAYLQKPVDPAQLLATIAEHLPAAGSTSTLAEPAPAETSPRVQPRVLLIEDDADLSLGLAIRLTHSGFEVAQCADATTALMRATRTRPDVILLDLGLPGGDGQVVLQRIAKSTVLASTPVIVVSARPRSSHEAPLLRDGAFAYFEKPVDPQSLLDCIRSACEIQGESSLPNYGEPIPQPLTARTS